MRATTSGIARARLTESFADYLQKNDSKCILLSATPYNKDYLDLASQLRLFVPADQDLGVGPQRLLQEMGEIEFVRQHQCGVRTLAAFEKSPYPDDWRELMRLYMVRRTRGFIKENYAETDPANGRKYLDVSGRHALLLSGPPAEKGAVQGR